MPFVIDASVALKWFVLEAGRERALEILRDVVRRPRSYAVPELFYFEITNIFNRLFPAPESEQEALLERLLQLGLHRLSMSWELARETSHFQRLGLSGYDAAYVALAKIIKGRWLTFDSRAHRRIEHLGLSRLLT